MESTNIKRQFLGFINTPLLWNNDDIEGIEQLEVDYQSVSYNMNEENLKQRLGHRVEEFFYHVLEQSEDIQLLFNNIQIFEDKKTLGELDFIISAFSQLIHLEIAYKFYLYDETAGSNEIDHWIGPNRKDSLPQKIQKLKTKQFPLLDNEFTKNFFSKIGFMTAFMSQKTHFKAQLFIPKNTPVNFDRINSDCVQGYYYRTTELNSLKDCTFYLPTKLEWLCTPHNEVTWFDIIKVKQQLEIYLHKKQSPMYWIKKPDNSISKIFIVWW